MMAQQDLLIAGRYQMGRLLGSGGFGAVYLGTDERLHRPVAIKVCSTQRLPAHEADEAARLFQSEALTLARLRHPGLTAIWDYFNQDDNWYLVMEYVPGQTLRELLRRQAGPLPQADALDYARQLCSVLGYLHSQPSPIVFRDLKPANIMITPEGQVKLIDFGIARLFSPGKAADTSQFGTPGYAPPEQYGGQTEPRSDMYSLGVVLHQMLTGHNPQSTPFALPALRSLNAALPDGLEALVARATAYHIDDRVATAAEFCSELDRSVRRPAPHAVAGYATPATTVPSYVAITNNRSASFNQSGTTSRTAWSPSPRTIPSKPNTATGIGRTLLTITLLAVLLGSIGVGAWLLRSQIGDYGRLLLNPLVVPQSPEQASQPQQAIFSSESENGTENLYATDLRTGKTQQITDFGERIGATQPAISPDGSRLAFNRETRVYNDVLDRWDIGVSEVWVSDIDGSNQRRLPLNYPFSRSPTWSWDGRKIAAEVASEGNVWRQHDIAIVDLETGSNQTLVNTPYWEGGPTWSPDGTMIAYQTRSPNQPCWQLYGVNLLNGVPNGAPVQLTSVESPECRQRSSGDFWADWSPDGSKLAFGRKLNGKEVLAVLTLQTGRVEELLTGSEASGYPRWSRDGRHLIFEQGKAKSVRLARYDLVTKQVDLIDTSRSGSHLSDWQ
jgi:serine/threonine protein kinase